MWNRVQLPQPQPFAGDTYDTQYLRWAVDCAGDRTRLLRMAVTEGTRVLADSTVEQG